MVSAGDGVNPDSSGAPRPQVPTPRASETANSYNEVGDTQHLGSKDATADLIGTSAKELIRSWSSWVKVTLFVMVIFGMALSAAWLWGLEITIGPISISRG